MTANLTEAVDFLWEHFRETAGGVEITAIRDGHVESRLVERDGVDWNDEHLAAVLSEMLTLNIDGYAIYYGVSTTTSARGGGRGGEHAVIGVPCYWADVDFRHVCPDMEPHRQEEYVYELLMNYLPEHPPSAIVHSGGGMQAMWTFWRPIPLNMYLNKPYQLKAVNQGIQQHVESDAVHNADRLLRLPGFVNHKYEHKPVAYVVKPYGDEPYTYLDFEKWRVVEPPKVQRPRVTQNSGGNDTYLNAAAIAAMCDKPRKKGSGYMACCPAHDDRSPSLSIDDGEQGTILKCFTGCDVVSICDSLGIRVGQLFREQQQVVNDRDDLWAME